jgi:hypothetical protein
MTSIQPLKIVNPESNVMSGKTPLISLDKLKDHTEALKGMSNSQRQSVLKSQLEVRQHTVIEHSGNIVGSFGDNGFKFFASNADASIALQFDPNDYARTLAALQKSYNGELTISSYSHGEGPKKREIYEQMYGKLPVNPISTFA